MPTTTTKPANPIAYRRSSKTYLLPAEGDSPPAEFPTRQIAEMAYIQATAPEVYRRVVRLSEKHPQLADRARRAGLLAIAQAVQPPPPETDFLAIVKSQSWVGGEYMIYYNAEEDGGGIDCPCDDRPPAIENRAGKFCKHTIAYYLTQPSE